MFLPKNTFGAGYYNLGIPSHSIFLRCSGWKDMFRTLSEFFPPSFHSNCGQLSNCYFIVCNYSTNYSNIPHFCLTDALKNFKAHC